MFLYQRRLRACSEVTARGSRRLSPRDAGACARAPVPASSGLGRPTGCIVGTTSGRCTLTAVSVEVRTAGGHLGALVANRLERGGDLRDFRFDPCLAKS